MRWYLSHPLGGIWGNVVCARQAARDLQEALPDGIDDDVSMFAPWVEQCWRDGPVVVAERDDNPTARAEVLARDCDDVRTCGGVLVLVHDVLSEGQRLEMAAAHEAGLPVLQVPCCWWEYLPAWTGSWFERDDLPREVHGVHQSLLAETARIAESLVVRSRALRLAESARELARRWRR